MSAPLAGRMDEFLAEAAERGVSVGIIHGVLASSRVEGVALKVPGRFAESLLLGEVRNAVFAALAAIGVEVERVEAFETVRRRPPSPSPAPQPREPEPEHFPRTILADRGAVLADTQGNWAPLAAHRDARAIAGRIPGCRVYDTLSALAEDVAADMNWMLRLRSVACLDFGRHSLRSQRTLADRLADFLARHKGTLVIGWEGGTDPETIAAWVKQNSFQAFLQDVDRELFTALEKALESRWLELREVPAEEIRKS